MVYSKLPFIWSFLSDWQGRLVQDPYIVNDSTIFDYNIATNIKLLQGNVFIPIRKSRKLLLPCEYSIPDKQFGKICYGNAITWFWGTSPDICNTWSSLAIQVQDWWPLSLQTSIVFRDISLEFQLHCFATVVTPSLYGLIQIQNTIDVIGLFVWLQRQRWPSRAENIIFPDHFVRIIMMFECCFRCERLGFNMYI